MEYSQSSLIQNLNMTPEATETMVGLVGEYLSLLDVVETTDDGREFRPNRLGSCRAMDGQRMNQILTELRLMIPEKNIYKKDIVI